MATSDAPVRVGRVALTVADLERTAAFYTGVMGLRTLRRDGGSVVLGQGERPLIELREDRAARPRPREAGLFHTAFLLPDRRWLARWLAGARARGLALDGAADHRVSEALYLHDPEGNGIEVYRDRPRERWPREDGRIAMDNRPLDLRALAALADAPWGEAPEGTVIGHVHLRVGEIEASAAFATERLGLATTARLPGASFHGSGGYHHHLAGNVWGTRDAGPRTPGAAGLADVELLADPGALPAGALRDPWGTSFTVTVVPPPVPAAAAG